MKQSVIIIPCNSRDEELLELLSENLEEVGWRGAICLAPCATAPPKTTLQTVSSVRWNTGYVSKDMLLAMLAAAELTGAEEVFKVDADMYFRKLPQWMLKVQEMTGYRHPCYGEYIAGAVYGMPVHFLQSLLKSRAPMRHTILEDVGVSRLAISEGVKLNILQRGIAGWQERDHRYAKDVDVIHLGEGECRNNAAALHKYCKAQESI